MKRFLSFLNENSWTYAGTGLVLITLSGPTLRSALWITGVTLILHSALSLSEKE
jgi:hypothetical protein